MNKPFIQENLLPLVFGYFLKSIKTCINSNVSISVNNERKLTSNISKSKLAFPLFNESYSSLIASLALKLLRIKPEYFFGDNRYMCGFYKFPGDFKHDPSLQ
jgi:hypothetical protein